VHHAGVIGSVGKEADGDAEKVIDTKWLQLIAEDTLRKETSPASSFKLTRRRRLRGAIGRLEMRDNANRMTIAKEKETQVVPRCKIEILSLSLIGDEMKGLGKLSYCPKHFLHELFQTVFCSANLRRWQGLQ
jgi:hypothetical protein